MDKKTGLITFDLWNTLIRREELVRAVANALKLAHDHVAREWFTEWFTRSLTIDQFLELFQVSGERRERAKELLCAANRSVHVIPGPAFEAFAHLSRERSVEIGLVSDCDPLTIEALESCGLGDVSLRWLSFEVGVRKKNGLYQRVKDFCDARGMSWLMHIGDDPFYDVALVRRAGALGIVPSPLPESESK